MRDFVERLWATKPGHGPLVSVPRLRQNPPVGRRDPARDRLATGDAGGSVGGVTGRGLGWRRLRGCRLMVPAVTADISTREPVDLAEGHPIRALRCDRLLAGRRVEDRAASP